MFSDLVKNLTTEQRRHLTAAGITNTRISEWKSGKSHPTRTQSVILCAVTGYDFNRLEIELAEVEAKKDAAKNSLIASVLTSANVRSILGFTSL